MPHALLLLFFGTGKGSLGRLVLEPFHQGFQACRFLLLPFPSLLHKGETFLFFLAELGIAPYIAESFPALQLIDDLGYLV